MTIQEIENGWKLIEDAIEYLYQTRAESNDLQDALNILDSAHESLTRLVDTTI